MSWVKCTAERWKVTVALSLFSFLVACTPGYFQQQSEVLAEQARLRDSVQIERSNQRLLVRQAQICLLSADGGTEAGAELLRTIQAGFSGYFLAVGVAGESIDYLRAVAGDSCPGATFLFYVQPAESPTCDANNKCRYIASQFVVTVVSVGDQSLVDRIQLSIKDSFLSGAASEQERVQKAFERLAMALTGAN